MLFLNKRAAAVSVRMMTWEVTTSFDGTLTETELRKRFDEEFGDLLGTLGRVLFWHLVSFNATDGRKHRYLVSIADEPLDVYRQKFDRCLPKQIALYAVADKILRGDWKQNEDFSKCAPSEGHLMLVALWDNVLYILVFMDGRLCHWSEEHGYGSTFDDRCECRVSRFKMFLKSDELFADVQNFNEAFVCNDELENLEELFLSGARDPFWRHLDLDESLAMKPCEKRRWAICAVAVLALGLAAFMVCRNPLKSVTVFAEVSPVELSLPAAHDLEMLAWTEGHRDLLPAKWAQGHAADSVYLLGKRRGSRRACDSQDFRLLGIVGEHVALVKTAEGESKAVVPGDSLSRYRVKRIGKNDVVLRCGGKEVRFEVGAR